MVLEAVWVEIRLRASWFLVTNVVSAEYTTIDGRTYRTDEGSLSVFYPLGTLQADRVSRRVVAVGFSLARGVESWEQQR